MAGTAYDTKDLKEETLHLDYAPTQQTPYADAQVKSALDNFTFLESISVFKRAGMVCFLAAFCAATDGYQNQIGECSISSFCGCRHSAVVVTLSRLQKAR